MDKNEDLLKRMFTCFSKVKRAVWNNNINVGKNENITSSELMLLFRISEWPKDKKIIVTDIVNVAGLAPSTISLTLNALEKNSYIERIVNKENRREIYVELTKRGKNIIDHMKKANHKFMIEFINHLGMADSQKFVELLEKAAAFLENRNKE